MLCILDNKLQSISNPDVSIKSSGSAADADVDDNDIDYQNIFIEDDMIVPVKTEDIKTDKDIERTHLNAVKEPKRLWPKDHRSGEVRIPYVIDRGYSKCFLHGSNSYFTLQDATSKDLMYLSMATICKFTCIRFETRAREYDYVRIMKPNLHVNFKVEEV